ncbi:MAG: LytR family transcriptional regulator [Acidimicrobiia bacterium]|nr:LytR family transcriptional regulator [Acidimicrobiia bacterium]
MKRSIVRLLLVIPLCGVLVAGLLSVAWIVLGSPTPAKGAIWFELTQFGDAKYSGSPTEPFYFLALGNDGRSDADKGLGDAIHVIGVNPAAQQATIINVPRDTTAPSGDKINAYFALQGLPGIVDQLNTMMGIKISYAITTNFPNLSAMVDEIGGIDINIPPITDAQDSLSLGGDQQYNDSYTGANFQPGPQRLNGEQALAFARDRHDFNLLGDIARSGNQALVIVSALATLRAQNPGDSTTLHYISILARHVKMMNVDVVSLWRLGRLGLSVDAATIKSITIPVGSGTGSNLVIGPGGAALFADFADDGIVQTAG